MERSPSPDRVQYSSSEESGEEEVRGEEEEEGEAESLYLEFLNHRIEEERLQQGAGGREEREVGREEREAERCTTQMVSERRQGRVRQHGAPVRSEGRVRRGGREEGVREELREGGAREEMREDLITLAERFSRSESREVVRRRAEEVQLDTMTQVRTLAPS